ncbi:hypothetical protein C8A01DRAFT_33567 [Parachaetomium inaequale]|uniref:Uncharacterized protein n=1 Tax=Parachaetomium inaequale TaxID=2588326 RepID=A0AAN6PP07_9PEZI|nr:hypothetical protein C8A01DRAFT_33567 [Parachaetomium inaequale]
MFLHSGASLHGHEYSNRPSNIQSPAHLRGSLRSAFSPPKQRARMATDGTPAPVLRQRPASDYIPREPSPVVRFREPQDDPPPTPSTHDESISESELSDVTPSIEGAVSARSARRRPRRTPRKSTMYGLGYPAPRIIGKTKVVQKVFLPRLLLQLQKVSAEGRSKPVLEVFPASRIAGPVVAPRLAKRFPGIFGVKRHLGYDDIVLVRRDDGDASCDGTESENEEGLEKRNLLAVYSPLKHSEEAEIVLDDGSVWVAKPLANGSFDFVHTDADGKTTTARWARRQKAAGTPTTDTSSSSAAPQTRYTFSIINPLTRRHPVMATLTPSTLDVQDTYTSVSPSHARHPPITRAGRSQSVTSPPSFARTAPYSLSKLSSSGSTSDGENDSAICIPASPDPESSQRTVHQIDGPTKMLISVTALWVCLRSGWSQRYNSSHPTTTAPAEATASPAPSIAICPRGRGRRNTWTTRSSTSDTPRPADLGIPGGADPSRNTSSAAGVSGNAGGGGGGVFKRYSMPTPAPSPAPARLPPLESGGVNVLATPAVSRTPSPTSMGSAADGTRPPPRRATSTGAAFMQRRLLASSSFSSERDAAEPAEAAGVQSTAIGQRGDGEGEKNKKRASIGPPKKVMEGGVEGGEVKKKKGGVRARLARWIHRFGSPSSSSER